MISNPDHIQPRIVYPHERDWLAVALKQLQNFPRNFYTVAAISMMWAASSEMKRGKNVICYIRRSDVDSSIKSKSIRNLLDAGLIEIQIISGHRFIIFKPILEYSDEPILTIPDSFQR